MFESVYLFKQKFILQRKIKDQIYKSKYLMDYQNLIFFKT